MKPPAMISIFLVVLVLDQATKIWASESLILHQPVPVIPNFFNLTLVHNPGAAFGMFADWSTFWRRIALTLVTILAVAIVVRFLWVEARGDAASEGALMLILGGASGNLVDRIRFDYVIDFLDFYYGNLHWPAFNIADSAICVGVGILVLRLSFGVNLASAKKETE